MGGSCKRRAATLEAQDRVVDLSDCWSRDNGTFKGLLGHGLIEMPRHLADVGKEWVEPGIEHDPGDFELAVRVSQDPSNLVKLGGLKDALDQIKQRGVMLIRHTFAHCASRER